MSGAFAGTTWADQAQLEEWFAGAAAGAQAIYATGPNLDPRHPVKLLVDDWLRCGEAVALPQVKLGPGLFRWALRRARPVARQTAGAAAAARRITIDDDFRETADGRIYLALVRAANLGLPCPSNAQLAEIGALPDADAARYRVKCLAQQGLIGIEHEGPGRALRRVRINQTGKWTADHGRAVLPGFEKGHAA